MTTAENQNSPPLPQDLSDTLLLAMVSGIGPRLRQLLLERFGSPTAILDAAQFELRGVQGIGPKLTRAISQARSEIDAAAEIELCEKHGIQLLTATDEKFPRMLREIHDPPSVLFVRGNILPQDALAIAIVGSRHATPYGKEQAERLGAGLSRAGLTIVSGLARGVDAAAHRGALNAGGRTLAVLGSGLLNIYPPEHKDLAHDVAAQGALISENPLHSPPMSGSFPQRNRRHCPS